MQKTVFITGSSSGIGKAAVDKFIKEGWNVAGTIRDLKDNPHAKHKRLLVLKLDVTDEQSIIKACNEAKRRFGTIDVLVNNAGYGLISPMETLSSRQIEDQFRVNVFGLIAVTNQFLPDFRKNKGGVILNISSMYGKISMPYFGMYAATKHAVEGLSESLQQEVNDFNIKVKLIEPGSIKTKFFKNIVSSKLPADSPYNPRFNNFLDAIKSRGNQGAAPEIAANYIYKAATSHSNKLRFKTDKTARLLINLHRFLPFRFYSAAIKKNVG